MAVKYSDATEAKIEVTLTVYFDLNGDSVMKLEKLLDGEVTRMMEGLPSTNAEIYDWSTGIKWWLRREEEDWV